MDSERSVGLNGPKAVEPVDWDSLVAGVGRLDPAALESLYKLLLRGPRRYLYNRLGPQDADDALHDVFLVIVQSIQRNGLRDPGALMAFAQTVCKRHFAERMGRPQSEQLDPWQEAEAFVEPGPNPETQACLHDSEARAAREIGRLKPRDMAVIVRFYVDGEPASEIRRDLGMSETQWRLRKWRLLDKLRKGYAKRTRMKLRPVIYA